LLEFSFPSFFTIRILSMVRNWSNTIHRRGGSFVSRARRLGQGLPDKYRIVPLPFPLKRCIVKGI
jgi:hypothetical protein